MSVGADQDILRLEITINNPSGVKPFDAFDLRRKLFVRARPVQRYALVTYDLGGVESSTVST